MKEYYFVLLFITLISLKENSVFCEFETSLSIRKQNESNVANKNNSHSNADDQPFNFRSLGKVSFEGDLHLPFKASKAFESKLEEENLTKYSKDNPENDSQLPINNSNLPLNLASILGKENSKESSSLPFDVSKILGSILKKGVVPKDPRPPADIPDYSQLLGSILGKGKLENDSQLPINNSNLPPSLKPILENFNFFSLYNPDLPKKVGSTLGKNTKLKFDFTNLPNILKSVIGNKDLQRNVNAFLKEANLPKEFSIKITDEMMMKSLKLLKYIQSDEDYFKEKIRSIMKKQFGCLDLNNLGDLFDCIAGMQKEISSFVTYKDIKISLQIISILCLILAMLLYLPSSTKPDPQKKPSLCLYFTLMIFLVLYLYSLITARQFNLVEDSTCLFLGLALQYVQLSFFAWMTIKFYDLFRIIRATVNFIPLSKLSNSNRFLKYCLISFGIPLLITTLTIILQFIPEDLVNPSVKPNIRFPTCWIQGGVLRQMFYFFLYIYASLALSTCFMCFSGYLLFKNESSFNCCTRARKQEGPTLNVHNKPSQHMFWEQFYILLFYVLLVLSMTIGYLSWTEYVWMTYGILTSCEGMFFLAIVLRSAQRRKVLLDALQVIRSYASSAYQRSKSRVRRTSAKVKVKTATGSDSLLSETTKL